MTLTDFSPGVVADPIRDVIRVHGAWPVLTRAALALLRPAPSIPADLARLDDRMLRDIGFEPLPRPQPWWLDLRLR